VTTPDGVCEDHPDQPWLGAHACSCGGARDAIPATRMLRLCRAVLQTTTMLRVTERGWSRKFDDPPPPMGDQLLTLEDAGTYITKLRCPMRVNRVTMTAHHSLPIFTCDERTSSDRADCSVSCQQHTHAVQQQMRHCSDLLIVPYANPRGAAASAIVQWRSLFRCP
jgi:hypothetical protein